MRLSSLHLQRTSKGWTFYIICSWTICFLKWKYHSLDNTWKLLFPITDPENEESPVPAIKVDLVPEAKSSDAPELKVEKTSSFTLTQCTVSVWINVCIIFIVCCLTYYHYIVSASPLFGSAGSSTFKSFSSLSSKMNNEKPSSNCLNY